MELDNISHFQIARYFTVFNFYDWPECLNSPNQSKMLPLFRNLSQMHALHRLKKTCFIGLQRRSAAQTNWGGGGTPLYVIMMLNMHLNQWDQIVFALNSQSKLDKSHPLKCVSNIFIYLYLYLCLNLSLPKLKIPLDIIDVYCCGVTSQKKILIL